MKYATFLKETYWNSKGIGPRVVEELGPILRHLPRPGRLSRERQSCFGPKPSDRPARRRKNQRESLEWERRTPPAPEGIRAGQGLGGRP